MAKDVVFKADRDGLVMELDDSCDFSAIKAALQEKFAEGKSFFQEDMIIKINPQSRCLSYQQKEELLALFRELPGVSVVEFMTDQTSFSSSDKPETKLVKRTLRSGQSIDFAGNIVIQGDVNPGAEVTAGKDILVLGEVRGTAHAGASGDLSSTISAFRLQPLQLRIGNIISRAPDECPEDPEVPEIAFVEGEQIIIDYLK